MGIQDRDYMRERARKAYEEDARWDRPFTPQREGPSLVFILLFWLSVAFLVYRGYEWLQARHDATRSRSSSVSRMASSNDAARTESIVINSPAENRHPLVPPLQVRIEPALPAPRPEPVQQDRRETSRAGTGGTIYLCRAYNGGSFWSQAHCAQHQALIESIVPVPPGLPFQQQVELAEQRRQPTTTVSNTTVTIRSETVNGARSECKALDARVEHLDAMARQPQSAQMQDWIRGERQEARDRQFALRC